jgi:DNA-binding response OmpR family regulator
LEGLDVLRAVSRIAPDTMVILLTAHGSLESAIEAIRYGAHDYLLKPASPQAIVNSITKAISRRTELLHKRALAEQREAALGEKREQLEEVEPRVLSLSNDVVVDLARREIWRQFIGSPYGRRKSGVREKGRGGKALREAERGGSEEEEKVRLTPTEAKLLRVLLENRGRVLTHRELVLMVQGYEVTDWEAPEVLRPLVSRLRQKLNRFSDGETWIVNVRGTGYVLERRQRNQGPSDGVERRGKKVMD